MIRDSIINLRTSKVAIPLLVMMVIISQSYTAISQAWTPDLNNDYVVFVLPSVKHCNVLEYPQISGAIMITNVTAKSDGLFHNARDPLKWWLNCVSYNVSNTPKLIPIFFNLALMPLVYLLARELTKDRIISLLTFVAFILNPLYSNWINSGTYDQVWSFFLILSVYLIYRTKAIGFGMISFVASLCAKSLGILYLPSMFYSIWDSDKKPDRLRIYLIGLIVVIFLGILIILINPHITFFLGGSIGLHLENLHSALFDNLGMLVYEIPFLMIFGYISWKYSPKDPSPLRKVCAVWVINSFLTTTFIYLFSTQFQFVYRFVPLAVFMSLFIAITINDLGRKYIENKLQTKS